MLSHPELAVCAAGVEAAVNGGEHRLRRGAGPHALDCCQHLRIDG